MQWNSSSGFYRGESCINQLITISHDIFKGFHDELEVRNTFLDISKVSDKVWHKGFVYKLRGGGICGNLLQSLLGFLDGRKQ